MISAYQKEDSVTEIRMQENQLDSASAQALCDLLALCPYLKRLDLQRNRLNGDAIATIQGFIERTRGVTTVTMDPGTGDITALSGNQVRIIVNLGDQQPPTDDPGASAEASQISTSASPTISSTPRRGSRHRPDCRGRGPLPPCPRAPAWHRRSSQCSAQASERADRPRRCLGLRPRALLAQTR